jgi:hypothetical protein
MYLLLPVPPKEARLEEAVKTTMPGHCLYICSYNHMHASKKLSNTRILLVCLKEAATTKHSLKNNELGTSNLPMLQIVKFESAYFANS